MIMGVEANGRMRSSRGMPMAARLAAALLLLLLPRPASLAPLGAARDQSAAAVRAVRPNVILILADDLGWADLAAYGNTYNETPNIDRLARQGVRFTQFYAGPVCSPTRANLQSGQDQARFGITQHIPGHRRPYARLIDPIVPLHLPLEVETFAERLRRTGYATGYFGKWHLGGPGYGPADQGWETAVEHQGNTAPPRVSGRGGEQRTAEFLTDKALDFIEANRDQPFLLQVSHFAVHIPLSTTPHLLAKYEAKPPMSGYPSLPVYAGLLEELDQGVGRIADTVDRLGLAERTLILFLSDNGGLEHEQSGRVVTSNQPLRGEKGTLYEGGIRVPAIARWTGRIPAATHSDTPVTTIDLYPTLLEIVDLTGPKNQPLDGTSFASLLQAPTTPLARDALYWHLPHYHHSTPASAIRRGDWKLIEFFEDGALELYNLRADPGEQTNRAAHMTEKGQELHTALETWREEVGARMPRSNPQYDPQRATELAKRQPPPTKP
ncbi:MAG: sulfatase-like hydrolase/transferase [Luteitalea sp.]|nr:sulfatase-like hydrolase/transferase [Luteitalea sp.]